MPAGNYDQALTLNKEGLASKRRVLGPGHFETLMASSNLGACLTKMGGWLQAHDVPAYLPAHKHMNAAHTACLPAHKQMNAANTAGQPAHQQMDAAHTVCLPAHKQMNAAHSACLPAYLLCRA